MRSGTSFASTGCPPRLGEECAEVPLLLPEWQLAALEKNALEQGLTVGQLTRRLIQSFLKGAQHTGSVPETRRLSDVARGSGSVEGAILSSE